MTRDLNVEYNLFKKRDYYYVDFWIDGVRYKKSTRKKRRIEAEIMAKEIIGATLEELYGHTELTLSHLVSRYGNVIKIENKTWKTKMAMLKLFMGFTGDIRLSKISPSLCQEFIIELPGRKIKQATVNRYIATLKHFFNKAIDWELMERNPMSRIKKFREAPRMRFFSSGELDRLITAAHQMSQENISHNQNMFYYIMMTAIYTGMRLGEIIHLKWMDIRDGNFLIKKTKSGLSRIVPIKKELMDVLRELPTTDEYVFPLNRRSSDVITKIWHKVRERAGIKEGRFHDLRHTFGSNLIKSGVDVVTVKELLGHSDLKMTQIYTHSSLGQKQRAISDLDI